MAVIYLESSVLVRVTNIGQTDSNALTDVPLYFGKVSDMPMPTERELKALLVIDGGMQFLRVLFFKKSNPPPP